MSTIYKVTAVNGTPYFINAENMQYMKIEKLANSTAYKLYVAYPHNEVSIAIPESVAINLQNQFR